MTVRELIPEDLSKCQAIIEGLPDYFTEDVPEKVQRDVQHHRGWVVTRGDEIEGFAIVDRRSVRAAEVLWMAMRHDRRHQGLGTTLLNHVLQALAGGVPDPV